LLIVNADDFGLSEGVNRGIIEAHQHGIVTSTSLMVRAPAAANAARLARAYPQLGVGLHVDMGEWALRDGQWIARYELVREGDAEAAAAELEAQVEIFVELMGKRPDHFDSHQHVHLSRPELSRAVARIGHEFGIGVRGHNPHVAYRGMYGQDGAGHPLPAAIGSDAYIEAIMQLSPGVTEFGCHPGYTEDLESDYRSERLIELRTLCDPSVRAAVAQGNVRLIRWSDVTSALGNVPPT